MGIHKGNPAVQSQNIRHRQLRHGNAVEPAAHGDRDVLLLGVGNIHHVHADTCTLDQLQVRAAVDDLLRHLKGRVNENIRVLQFALLTGGRIQEPDVNALRHPLQQHFFHMGIEFVQIKCGHCHTITPCLSFSLAEALYRGDQ